MDVDEPASAKGLQQGRRNSRRRNRIDSRDFSWPSWNPSGDGPNCLVVPSRRTCWSCWPVRPCRSTMRGGRSRSRQKIYRCAFVRPKELLGGISTPTRPCAPTGSGVLPLLCVGSASPKPGVQARESEVSGVLGTRKHRLSRSRRNGPRRHRVVLDRRTPRVRQTSCAKVAVSVTAIARACNLPVPRERRPGIDQRALILQLRSGPVPGMHVHLLQLVN